MSYLRRFYIMKLAYMLLADYLLPPQAHSKASIMKTSLLCVRTLCGN